MSPPISEGGAGTLSGTVSFPWKQCQDSGEGVQPVCLRTNTLAGRGGRQLRQTQQLLSNMQSSHALTGSSVGKEPTFNAGDQVRSLGREGPLEEEMATCSSISCLNNPMERRAWWAIVHGVPQKVEHN